MDLHAGAGGKVLLAYAPAEVLAALRENERLAVRTASTITDFDKLLRELELIRKQGFAVSMGERVQDACAIAAPVFEKDHQLVCALAIVGPVSRFTAPNRKIYTAKILTAAARLSDALAG
jgi:DNA-binding IclR family transcriptional regulator